MNLSIGASSLQGLRPFSSSNGGRDRDRFGAASYVYTQERIRSRVEKDFGTNVKVTTRESERRPVSKVKPADGLLAGSHALIDSRPSLTTLLTEHSLLIKYKRGDKEIPKLKKSLKKGAYNKMVTFRTDRTLEWAPQYFLNEELTNLQGYLHGDDLRNNLIDQLDEWEQAKKAEEEKESEEESSEEESSDESEGMTSDESENEDEDEDEDGSELSAPPSGSPGSHASAGGGTEGKDLPTDEGAASETVSQTDLSE